MKRAEVAATEYEAGQPMDTVLQKVAEQTTISEPQKIAIAYINRKLIKRRF